eukprot:CAMPEP_0195254194 /NCGR_PEP_ID=MMETSP0706-20130129/4914_1 /TAXON_ID=33640 /ORGANISM="Asterionellopsis glacialis, Strain CCMP134" /LENGTH=112 /DNA_ID=CAMNT_0040306837 /DNA_START=234 /DNA_END=572 /DNA_ORIENTATION=+
MGPIMPDPLSTAAKIPYNPPISSDDAILLVSADNTVLITPSDVMIPANRIYTTISSVVRNAIYLPIPNRMQQESNTRTRPLLLEDPTLFRISLAIIPCDKAYDKPTKDINFP